LQVIKVTPRGYCYGVVDAIEMAKRLAKSDNVRRPIYILGMVVHNQHVVDMLHAEYGIITLDGADRLELLKQVPDGSTVLFTAHGISPEVRAAAMERDLDCYDATCPDVTRTHDLVRELCAAGYHIIYIGRAGHPEAAGILGEAPDRIHLVQREEDLLRLKDKLPPGVAIAVTTQTTMSQWDTQELIDKIKAMYPGVLVKNEICLATQERQEAVVAAAAQADVVIVVGDRRSHNSTRLVEVVRRRAGKPAYLVDGVEEITPEMLAGCRVAAVTSGSSTPTYLTRQVISYLEQYGEENG